MVTFSCAVWEYKEKDHDDIYRHVLHERFFLFHRSCLQYKYNIKTSSRESRRVCVIRVYERERVDSNNAEEWCLDNLFEKRAENVPHLGNHLYIADVYNIVPSYSGFRAFFVIILSLLLSSFCFAQNAAPFLAHIVNNPARYVIDITFDSSHFFIKGNAQKYFMLIHFEKFNYFDYFTFNAIILYQQYIIDWIFKRKKQETLMLMGFAKI